MACRLKYAKFSAFNGWLQTWKKKRNIRFKSISWKSADSYKNCDLFFWENIYKADESGLYCQALPYRTSVLKSESGVGGKLSKKWLAILFCTSMTGEKEKFLMIGKATRPPGFKNVSV